MEKKRAFKTIDMLYIALATVLIAVCSWISIPMGETPFTMQTFAIFCVLSMLGGRRGLAAVVVYLLLGAVGVPVFAGFTAGIGIIVGITGGYLLGFVFVCLIYWLAVKLFGKKLWVEITSMVIGLVVLYAFGTAWFMVIYARMYGAIGVTAALTMCVLPFVIPDLIKLGLALLVARRVHLEPERARSGQRK